MSGTIFQSELSSLIQESKRKHTDVREAAERSLADLKAINVTSETQLAGDLLRKPSFVDPFVLGCHSRNAKLVSSSVVCLQRLAASRALPSARLKDVLDAFREVTSSTFDVQIKILQTLPSLLQTYASYVHGSLLFTSLEICAALQGSKTAVISSTASATLQQLISSAFERIADEVAGHDSDSLRDLQIEDVVVKLKKGASDGFDIFSDLCDIADGVDAKHIKSNTISLLFVLDLITTLLIDNEEVFRGHTELIYLCRRKLMPAVLRLLSSNHPFNITIRSLRMLYHLIASHLEDLRDESETALGLLIHFLDPEASQAWKRAACLEVLRRVISSFSLIRQVFNLFDMQEGRKDIVSKLVASLAKMAAEKPAVIGLSYQSTVPARHTNGEEVGQEQASLEAAGVEGVIGGNVVAEAHISGISVVWSRPETSCLEQLDKNNAPSLPETYIYSLVLDCMSSISEGLAKFVMPVTALRGERKRTQVQASEQVQDLGDQGVSYSENETALVGSPIGLQKGSKLDNPPNSTQHPQSDSIKVAAALVTTCWPAFLATCATFLNAALDAEFYHNLVRAIQKFAQVAGILELSTPRDAFLTTLAKAAVPPQAPQSNTTTDTRKVKSSPIIANSPDSERTIASAVSKLVAESPVPTKPEVASLTKRNLLCLRALLNLGIALGPTLSQEAWFILLETLQEAERLIRLSPGLFIGQNGRLVEDTSGTEPNNTRGSLSGEVVAVQTASRKMFASTANYEKGIFLGLLRALFSLSPLTSSSENRKDVPSHPGPSAFRRVGRMHQSSWSTSGPLSKANTEDSELVFILSKTSEMARSNLQRFANESATDSGWSLITDSLLAVIKSSTMVSDVPLRAANLLNSILLGTLEVLDDEDEQSQREVQHRCISALKSQIDGLYRKDTFPTLERRNVDFEIHEHAIESLISIIERHGENLLVNWGLVLKLGGSIFEKLTPSSKSDSQQEMHAGHVTALNVKLISVAFRLLQLIGSDFLNLLALQDLLDFIEILLLFGRQHDDLNVSLTSTTFFWNLADFLHSSQHHPSLNDFAEVPMEEFLCQQITRAEDQVAVVESLWLVLLLRLKILTVDPRPEVRNVAVQVTLRILDASGPSFSSRGWHICLRLILLPLLKSYASLLAAIWQEGSHDDFNLVGKWYNSTVTVLEGSMKLVSHFISPISANEQFFVLWEELFGILESILASSTLAVSSATFRGVKLLFASLRKANHSDPRAADPALRLWVRRHPADILSRPEMRDIIAKEDGSNQDAFTAHAEVLVRVRETLPTVKIDRSTAKDITQALRKTIFNCVHPPYGTDVHKMASEQENVVATLQLLSETSISESSEYHKTLFDFIRIAFKDEVDTDDQTYMDSSLKKGTMFRNGQIPSFVAFSSKCIDLLEHYVLKTLQLDVLADSSFPIPSALNVLSDTIRAKYTAKAHRGDPLLWRKATASALSILEGINSCNPNLARQGQWHALYEIYASSIDIASGILGSGDLENMTRPPERSALLADEEHDIEAFKRFSRTLIPALMSLKESKNRQFSTLELHRNLVVILFRASMISAPQYGDLPSEQDLISSPILSLLHVRPGTIKDPIYHARRNIPFLALDILFNLTVGFDGNKMEDHQAFTAYTLLARTVAPYLLLRVAHTLKSFIADQPLRGPMPMPSMLREEMIYVLRSCLKLRSEDEAFMGYSGSEVSLGQDGKRHLRLLYPLILRMWNVWRRVPRYGFSWITDLDGVEIEKYLVRWMELCGESWKLAEIGS